MHSRPRPPSLIGSYVDRSSAQHDGGSYAHSMDGHNSAQTIGEGSFRLWDYSLDFSIARTLSPIAEELPKIQNRATSRQTLIGEGSLRLLSWQFEFSITKGLREDLSEASHSGNNIPTLADLALDGMQGGQSTGFSSPPSVADIQVPSHSVPATSKFGPISLPKEDPPLDEPYTEPYPEVQEEVHQVTETNPWHVMQTENDQFDSSAYTDTYADRRRAVPVESNPGSFHEETNFGQFQQGDYMPADFVATTVHLSKLNLHTKERDVEAFLSDCGNIVQIRLALAPNGQGCRGMGDVEFDSPIGAYQAVMKKNGQTLRNYTVKVEAAEELLAADTYPHDYDPGIYEPTTLHLKGFSITLGENRVRGELVDFFKRLLKYDAINHIRLPPHKGTNNLQGMAFVVFNDHYAWKRSFAAQNANVAGGRLDVNQFVLRRIKDSSRPPRR